MLETIYLALTHTNVLHQMKSNYSPYRQLAVTVTVVTAAVVMLDKMFV